MTIIRPTRPASVSQHPFKSKSSDMTDAEPIG
jgi:hypothetical protein